MTRPALLCLGHAADRTGPPAVLLELLRHLDATQAFDVSVLLLRGGERLPEMEALARVWVLDDPAPARIPDVPRPSDLPTPDVVLVNTAWSSILLPLAGGGSAPIVTLVHELDEGLGRALGTEAVLRLVRASERLVVGTPEVGRLLVDRYEADIARVHFVAYGIDLDGLHDGPAGGRGPEVVAAGTPTWRKGPDLFVRMAGLVHARRPHTRFRWIGGPLAAALPEPATIDQTLLGLERAFEHRPTTADLRTVLSESQVFAMTSREDAFPLVGLEAIAAGLPIVSFASGGLAELLAAGPGTVVGRGDLQGFADAVVAYLDDAPARLAAVMAGQARLRSTHDARITSAAIAAHLDLAMSQSG